MKEGLVIYKELFSCRIFGISKLFHEQKLFWHRFKADSFWRNSSDSYGEVFRCDENFLLLKKMWRSQSDIWLVTKGWNFNFRVIENRLSTKMWKTQSDIWWVTKGWNINLRVIENRFQSIHFICMNNDLARMRKRCLPIQIACLWTERAWLGTQCRLWLLAMKKRIFVGSKGV